MLFRSALSIVYCYSNQLTSLDVSQNTALTRLKCSDNNQLTSLDVRNGNNTNIIYLKCENNPNLSCINVDDSIYSTNNWMPTITPVPAGFSFDSHHYFSTNCSSTTSIQEHTTKKELLRTIDVLGRETKNTPLFYIYDDGTVEKRIVIE